jgi:hypothetical protein
VLASDPVFGIYSAVAQSAEQVAVNHRVGGSSPSCGAKEMPPCGAFLLLLGLGENRPPKIVGRLVPTERGDRALNALSARSLRKYPKA